MSMSDLEYLLKVKQIFDSYVTVPSSNADELTKFDSYQKNLLT